MILPGMQIGLRLSDTQAGILVAASLLGYLAVSVSCGFLTGRFGYRVTITFFLSVTGAAALFLGLSRSFTAALPASILLGIGSAGSNIPMMSLLALWFSSKRRGMAVGLSTSGSSLGLLITGLIIPFFYSTSGMETGWIHAWYCLAGFVIVISVLGGFLLRSPPDRPNKKLRVRHLYKEKILWHLAGIYTLFGLSYIIYATFFASYLVSEIGFSIHRAGSLWSVIGIISIGSGLLWGSISDKVGRKYALALVFLLQGLCYGIFGVWKSMPGVLLSSLLFSLTSWSIPAIMAASAGDLFEPRIAPAAFGFITLFFGIGQATGPVVAGAVADLTGSFTHAFAAAAVFALAGSAGSLLLRREFNPTP